MAATSKILYGSKAILVDEVMDPSAMESRIDSLTNRAVHLKNMHNIIKIYNSLQGCIASAALHFLKKQGGIREGVARWRQRVAMRKAAAAGLPPPPTLELSVGHLSDDASNSGAQLSSRGAAAVPPLLLTAAGSFRPASPTDFSDVPSPTSGAATQRSTFDPAAGLPI